MLVINTDLTFRMDTTDENQKVSKAGGTYQVSSVKLPSGTSPTLELTYTLIDGKPAPKGSTQRLLYESKGDILHDVLTVAFARGDRAPAMKQALEAEEAKRRGPAMRFDMGQWKKRWELPLKSGRVPDSEVLSLGRELVTTSEESLLIVGENGKTILSFKTGGPNGYLASGFRDGAPFLVPYAVWAQTITAYDRTGKELWTFKPNGDAGIDSVAPIRLDKTNTGVVLGYNGGGGVDIVGSDGKLIKHINVKANVWTVCGARLSSQLPEAAIVVEQGALAFSTSGATLARFDPKGGCGKVAAMDLNGDGIDEILTLGDTVSSGLQLYAFDQMGKELWSVKPKSLGMFLHTPIFPLNRGGKTLIGVANSGGIALLSTKGEPIDYMTVDATGVTALPRPGTSDLLIVRRINGLACYE